MTKKILLVYAGGTIGMEVKDGALAPPQDENDFQRACLPVVEEFERKVDKMVDFKYFDKQDSTERTPMDWINLCALISEIKNTYAAVVFAHGTDTLANTAAAISLAFGHPDFPGKSSLSIPIVFTASQLPIYKNGGDGKFNLYNALEVAIELAKKAINRVSISFSYKVLLGTRAMKNHDKRFDAFDSPAVQPIGLITAGGVEISHFVKSLPVLKKNSHKFSEGITTIEISPSTPRGIITVLAETQKTKVLILKTLGEGNVPNRLISEIEEQTKKGKIIVLSSPFAGGSVGASVYELGAKAIKAGAIPAGDMVPPAVDAKCSWLIGNGITGRDDFAIKLQQNHAGEISHRKAKDTH